MTEKLLALVFAFINSVIGATGYSGVALLMAIESACIPLPSELIMPFAGYLVFTGTFKLLWVATAGALGCNLGSLVAYEIGCYGGRPLVERYGRWILMGRRELDWADRFFARWGYLAVFLGRLLPVIRTFIALPAGIARMPRGRFHVYTFLGSWPWCLGLAYFGMKLGENWRELGKYFHKFDAVIGVVLVAGAVWFVWTHWQNRIRTARSPEKIREARRQSREVYGELFDATAALLFRHDPISISFDNPNVDEYAAEAETILPRLNRCRSSEEVQRVVHEEFVRWFDADTAGPPERYERIASDLWQLWQRSSKSR